jgi:hypothetical protein
MFNCPVYHFFADGTRDSLQSLLVIGIGLPVPRGT